MLLDAGYLPHAVMPRALNTQQQHGPPTTQPLGEEPPSDDTSALTKKLHQLRISVACNIVLKKAEQHS
jgi:hypothetical protein